MPDHLSDLRTAYRSAKDRCGQDWSSRDAGMALHDFAMMALRFLTDECSVTPLVSLVPGKEYVSYVREDKSPVLSRAVNKHLFVPEPDTVSKRWLAWLEGASDSSHLATTAYTVALAPCLALELFDRQNRKGPATYFEALVGHIAARRLGANPTKRASLPVCGRQVRMTMDFLFDLDDGTKIHLPVKMSTRERVVQAWAHQSLLASAYGEGSYKGLMVLFAETKLDSRSREVVEICVPDQWLAYQSLLAKMDRIYYFDPPERYRELARDFPDVIRLSPFSDFLSQTDLG